MKKIIFLVLALGSFGLQGYSCELEDNPSYSFEQSNVADCDLAIFVSSVDEVFIENYLTIETLCFLAVGEYSSVDYSEINSTSSFVRKEALNLEQKIFYDSDYPLILKSETDILNLEKTLNRYLSNSRKDNTNFKE